jgi:hypothetical protein
MSDQDEPPVADTVGEEGAIEAWHHRGADCCSEPATAELDASPIYLSARARRNPGMSAEELEAAEAEAAEWARISNRC